MLDFCNQYKNKTDMLKFNLKQIFLLTGILLFTVWCNANNISASDGYGSVPVKEATVQGCPKGSSIQASINGHLLTVVFLENLGQVTVEITTSTDSPVDFITMATPNGYQYYIPNTGDYIITFTLENGDVYYGEFTVTD